MKTSIAVALVLSLTFFVSCSKSNNAAKTGTDSTQVTPVVTIGTISGGLGVYAAGYETFYKVGSDSLPVAAGAPRVAKIWKDGAGYNMTDGSYDAVANAVWANGVDVYAVGFERNADSIQVATLWKDGKSIRLGDGKNNSVANGIYVYGSDVYVAGNIVTNTVSAATLWKNGTAASLDNGGVANSVYVYGNDVYVCGSDPAGAARIWKDGVGSALVNGGLGDANSVYVSGGDVYVAGTFENNGVLPGYWKNGKWTLLNYSSGTATSIYVEANKVLIAGEIITDPALWINGSASPLYDSLSATADPTKIHYFKVISVFGAGNHIRLAGYRTTHQAKESTTTHDLLVPILFTDGTSTTLDNGDSQATLKVFNKTGGKALSVFTITPS